MSFLGTCWACGETGPIELFLADAQARQALASALRLPSELAELILPYLVLHAPAPVPGGKRRRLEPGKLTRLLAELDELIRAGEVTRQRESRAAPMALWAEGLREILKQREAGTLDLPLSGHGLLRAIVFRLAGVATAPQTSHPSHPSHRPAVLDAGPGPEPAPATAPAAPPTPRPDWTDRRRAGLTHISQLKGQIGQPPE